MTCGTIHNITVGGGRLDLRGLKTLSWEIPGDLEGRASEGQSLWRGETSLE